MKTLIIDNNIDKPWGFCPDIRRYVEGHCTVRRGPEGDLPKEVRRYTHIILSGSKTSAMDESAWLEAQMRLVREAVDAGVPVLGICFGHQLIARTYGGISAVRAAAKPEFGWVKIEKHAPHPLLEGLPDCFHSFQSHYDEVISVPDSFTIAARSERCSIQAYSMKNKPLFGIQFHPERNAEEGQASIERRKKTLPGDCIFNDGKAKSVFNENVARNIFGNFLRARG